MQGKSLLRALVLGGAMSLGGALSGLSRQLKALDPIQTATAGSGKGEGRSRSASPRYRSTCTSSRKTRNPSDPAQAYLIARAEAKRARRAEKLKRDTARAWIKNPCISYIRRQDPFAIAK